MWKSILAVLPLAAALHFPHLPTPNDALSVAESLLHPGPSSHSNPETILSYANDMTLSSVPNDEHVVITSQRHPNHKMRIKSHQGWCDPDVKSYSGYLDVGYGRDLFFYFFESRSKPSEDPVIMWINGGPGCSSSLGLFMELGPCSVKDDPKSLNDTQYNPHSWTSKANMFFVDEPIGVGFSRAEHGQTVSTTEEAAMDIQAFVQIFFEAFKEFEGRAFHMAGESYGGRYLPVFASAVVDGNQALRKAGVEPINLQSVMIGNGATDMFSLLASYFPYQCTLQHGLNHTTQSIQNCVALAKAVPKCHRFAEKGCLESHDYTECSMALGYCQEVLEESFFTSGVNPYDVSKPCSPEELATSLCYSETDKIATYLDLPDVRSFLGVYKHAKAFHSCSNRVGNAFSRALDSTDQTWLYVTELLERGVRVLNYVGTFDWICNHIANEAWMERLEWSGKKGYNAEEFGEWKVGGKVAGKYKTHENLSMLKIFNAGHMVPFDKPKEALAMLNAWIGAEKLDT